MWYTYIYMIIYIYIYICRTWLDARMRRTYWGILRCFLRCNSHKQVQEQSACEMLSTFIWACAKKCKTKLPVRFPSVASTEKQIHTKKIMSVRRAAPWARSSHSPSTAPKELQNFKCSARVQNPFQNGSNATTLPKMLNMSMTFPDVPHLFLNFFFCCFNLTSTWAIAHLKPHQFPTSRPSSEL